MIGSLKFELVSEFLEEYLAFFVCPNTQLVHAVRLRHAHFGGSGAGEGRFTRSCRPFISYRLVILFSNSDDQSRDTTVTALNLPGGHRVETPWPKCQTLDSVIPDKR